MLVATIRKEIEKMKDPSIILIFFMTRNLATPGSNASREKMHRVNHGGTASWYKVSSISGIITCQKSLSASEAW